MYRLKVIALTRGMSKFDEVFELSSSYSSTELKMLKQQRDGMDTTDELLDDSSTDKLGSSSKVLKHILVLLGPPEILALDE